jgi:hypothetical protein
VSGAFENERVQRMDADLDLLNARIEGVSNRIEALDSNVAGLGDDLTALAENILRLSQHLAAMVEQVSPLIKLARQTQAVSRIGGEPAKDRKVWVVQLPDAVILPESEVMIEQFGDGLPTIAFREDRNAVWGRPFRSEKR